MDLSVPIRTEYVGGCADMIPAITCNSASRVQMFTSHVIQSTTCIGIEPPATLTGVEMEYAKYVTGAKVGENCHIRAIARRYSNRDQNPEPVEIALFVWLVESRKLDVIIIDTYRSDHQYFGYDLNVNENLPIKQDGFLKKGEWCTRSPRVKSDGINDVYSTGLHANALTASSMACIEDAIEVSDEFAAANMSYGYRRNRFWLSPGEILLLGHGTEENPRPWPRRGEFVGADGILVAKRKFNPLLAAVECNTMALRETCGMFDMPITVEPDSEVIDIKVIRSPADNSKRMEIATRWLTEEERECQLFYSQILEYYFKIEGQLQVEEVNGRKRRHTEQTYELTGAAHRLFLEAIARFPSDPRINVDRNKSRLQLHYDVIDEWYVEIITKYKIPFNEGSKMTEQCGGKGCCSSIRPVKDMPIDEHGNIIHVIMSSLAVLRRTNYTRTFTMFINAARRDNQKRVLDIYERDGLNEAWYYLISFLEAASPIWAECVRETHMTDAQRQDMLEELYHNRLIIAIPHETRKMIDDIQRDILEKFPPNKSKLTMTTYDGRKVQTLNTHMTGELYFMRLDKTGKDMSAIAVGTRQHFGTIAKQSPAERDRRYMREHPIAWMGESEARHQAAYCRSGVLEEHHDRANNPITAEMAVENIMTSHNPMRLKYLVNRDEYPLGQSSAVRLVHSVLNCGGVRLTSNKG